MAVSGSKTTKSLGGGSSAVAASAHANCARFRGTDPLITGLTRRGLAEELKFPDTGGTIPEARWMRAMTFERLVKDHKFASRVATTAVGAVRLDRPKEIVIANAHVSSENTAQLLQKAHDRAVAEGGATLLYALAIPFVGYEDSRATDVKPDFAVVAPTLDRSGSWLIVGDAKDYERVRSRIDDKRLLKGFLQVAVGAESAKAWSLLPAGMQVHDYGVLAVPRNSFLQPEALVEDLRDHRHEVEMRIRERRNEAQAATYDDGDPVDTFVAHLEATFDPSACSTCTLFGYCRDELRRSSDPEHLLIEIGVPRDQRQHVAPLLHGGEAGPAAPATLVGNVVATRDGVAVRTEQLRVDPIGRPGTINVVLAKSDAAALGVHGLALQRISSAGPGEWSSYVFDDPQSPKTRSDIIKILGKSVASAMAGQRKANQDTPDPIHLVVPDAPTADLLVSIADNMAGLELNRLRWERDKDMGRPQLTYNGDPAIVPPRLSEKERTAVSFLLEEDRARAFRLRSPILNAQAVLTRHLVTGGAPYNALRLDYLLAWAQRGGTIDHRQLTDEVEQLDHTPGARMTSARSNAIHQALVGVERTKGPRTGPVDPDRYQSLVLEELRYKCEVLDGTLKQLATFEASNLLPAYEAIEAGAQAVWRRRLTLQASDLVRFGRTYRPWRNNLVPQIEQDNKCREQLLALVNPTAARDMAADAGTKALSYATVVSADPVVLDIASRRIADGSRIVLLHQPGANCAEHSNVAIKIQGGSFRLSGLSIGLLSKEGLADDTAVTVWRWKPVTQPLLEVGARVIVADFAWFSDNKGSTFLNVDRPSSDHDFGPKPACNDDSYDGDPEGHKWCCRPHAVIEAEFSDDEAKQRAAGLLNPQVWPPVRDDDGFEVLAVGLPTGDPFDAPSTAPPDHLTIDDLDVTL